MARTTLWGVCDGVPGHHQRDLRCSGEALQQYNRRYRAPGVEIESSYQQASFALNGGATYTAAKISSDDQDPTVVGHRPKRSAKLIYKLAPS